VPEPELPSAPRPRRAVALVAAIAALALGLVTSGPASAGDPSGLWLTKDRDAKVQVADCRGALCGTVVWLKDPIDPATGNPVTDKHNVDRALRSRPLIGVRIVLDMKPSGTADKWAGHIYNSDDGKTYRGSITLQNPTALKVEGCVMAFCEAELWTRTE
jgi:uncharacterized protein (DUF2147 family)